MFKTQIGPQLFWLCILCPKIPWFWPTRQMYSFSLWSWGFVLKPIDINDNKKNHLTNKNAAGCLYFVLQRYCIGLFLLFFSDGGCFCFARILIYYSGAAEDHICITQSHNKKKKTLHFSDHIHTLSDKSLQSSVSAAAFCHECQWRPGIQQYVCSNPRKCTIGGWHLVLSGSFL